MNSTKAETLARIHMHELEDKAGRSLVSHLERVVASLPPEASDALKCIAWLHDFIEDTPFDAGYLYGAGFPQSVVSAVEILTQRPGEDYADYIGRVVRSDRRDVILIKLLDNRDNTLPWRMIGLSQKDKSYLHRRYSGAQGVLETAYIRACRDKEAVA